MDFLKKKMLTSLEIRQLIKILLKASQQHPKHPTKNCEGWIIWWIWWRRVWWTQIPTPQTLLPLQGRAYSHSFWVCCPYFRGHLSCRELRCTPQSLADLGASGLSHFSSVQVSSARSSWYQASTRVYLICRQTWTVPWHFPVTSPASFLSLAQISRAPQQAACTLNPLSECAS